MRQEAGDHAAAPWTSYRFVQLLAVPRSKRPASAARDAEPDPGYRRLTQLFAALTSAHATLSGHRADGAGAFAMAWFRSPAQADHRVVLGGQPVLPWSAAVSAKPAKTLRIPYPPGALVRELPAGQLGGWLTEFPSWVACTAVPDALWTKDDGKARDGSFDDYAACLSEPFAWVVLAEPLQAEELDEELTSLETQIPRMRQRQNSEADRVRLERSEARYRELARSRIYGTWSVRVLVGGMNVAQARATAALLCGASELGGLPYALTPSGGCGSQESLLQAFAHRRAGDAPFAASTEMVAALARPPEKEMPGIRVITPPTFDITPEHSTGTGFSLGTVLDETLTSAGEFLLSPATLNRHAFVCGATGAGKSQTVRSLLDALATSQPPVPWLVIEPAKSEYARMAGRLAGRGKVTIIRPGDSTSVPGCLNPLEPEPGFPIQTHIDLIRALFLAAFEAYEPFPQVLSHALTRCYQNMGWDLALSESRLPGITPAWPTLTDLQREALSVVEHIGYGREVTADVRGFIDVRISSLRLGTPGRFFEGGHPLDLASLLSSNTVLELEDIGNDQDKAFLIGAVLIRVAEHLRQRWGRYEGELTLRHVTVVEEAHRLLKVAELGSPAAHAVELFAALIAEIRAYGEGIVVAEQIPGKIVTDVIKNSALKIVHRLPAQDDRLAVGATMNLDERQSQYVVTLPPGQAAVFADGMDHPVLVAMPYREEQETATGASREVGLAGRRGMACGTQCRVRACTLREIALGERAAADPHVILWLELLIVAHLVGEPEPRPDRTWLAGLRKAADRRTLECAVANRIDTAITSRYGELVSFYQPESLAAHVADCAMRWLDGAAGSCEGNEIGWQAGRYRWIDVVRSLHDGTPKDRPHPATASWRARGLELPGSTQAKQLEAWRRHPDTWLPSRTVIEGRDSPPAYERAASQLSDAIEPIDRLARAVTFLATGTDWPETRLYPEAWRARREAT